MLKNSIFDCAINKAISPSPSGTTVARLQTMQDTVTFKSWMIDVHQGAEVCSTPVTELGKLFSPRSKHRSILRREAKNLMLKQGVDVALETAP